MFWLFDSIWAADEDISLHATLPERTVAAAVLDCQANVRLFDFGVGFSELFPLCS